MRKTRPGGKEETLLRPYASLGATRTDNDDDDDDDDERRTALKPRECELIRHWHVLRTVAIVAMLVFQTNPVRVRIFSHVNTSFCCDKLTRLLAKM